MSGESRGYRDYWGDREACSRCGRAESRLFAGLCRNCVGRREPLQQIEANLMKEIEYWKGRVVALEKYVNVEIKTEFSTACACPLCATAAREGHLVQFLYMGDAWRLVADIAPVIEPVQNLVAVPVERIRHKNVVR